MDEIGIPDSCASRTASRPLEIVFPPRSAFRGTVAACVIHQDLPHELCGNGEKVGTTSPTATVSLPPAAGRHHALRLCFAECDGTLAAQGKVRQTAQFLIHNRQHLIQCLAVAALLAPQQLCDLTCRLMPHEDDIGKRGSVWVAD